MTAITMISITITITKAIVTCDELLALLVVSSDGSSTITITTGAEKWPAPTLVTAWTCIGGHRNNCEKSRLGILFGQSEW